MNPALARLIDFVVPFGPILRSAESRPPFADWPFVIWRALAPTFFFYWAASLVPYVGTLAYMAVLVPASAALHAERSGRPFEEVLLKYFVVVLIGFGGVWSFIGHTILADQVATDIGWETGSPFQIELAFFTLGSAVAGLLGIWIGGHLVTALVITKSILLYGAAGVHIYEAAVERNFSYLNIGPPLIGDLLFPTVMLVLLYRQFPNIGIVNTK